MFYTIAITVYLPSVDAVVRLLLLRLLSRVLTQPSTRMLVFLFCLLPLNCMFYVGPDTDVT